MSSERPACGLGTLFPMSCRGPAEAFARSLQSRLQSLGRPDPTDTNSEDEKSWLNRQQLVTNHQPRLSSSSESDIYYDFDVECESPAEESEADVQATKPRILQQLSSESGCFPSPGNVFDPGSDTSEGPFYDPDTGGAAPNVASSSSVFYNGVVEGPVYRELGRGTDDSSLESTDGASSVSNREDESPTLGVTNRRDSWKSSSNEGSSNDEFFECDSPKDVNSVPQSLSSLCLHDSGYPNTEESSRCNSQNETYTFENRYNIAPENLLEINNNHTEAVDEQIPQESPDGNNLSENDAEVDSETQQTSEDRPSSKSSRPQNLVIETPGNEDWSAEQQGKSDEEDELRPTPRVRRCSSLKSGKTPPGTPSRKKIVRFADVLGLDLADVRTFLDEIPKVPKSAYEDLECADLSSSESPPFSMPPTTEVVYLRRPEKCLIALFQQPGGLPDFMDRVREKQVCLENAVVSDAVSFSITGTARVRNLDFHKSVHVRYTLDGWETYADLQATYVPNSCDGFSDKFSFLLYAHTVQIGQRLEFAVRFQCKEGQYWDNNNGRNYVFQCLPTSCDSAPAPVPLSPDFNTFY